MRSIEGNRVTFDGDTYELLEEGSLAGNELRILAKTPLRDEATLVYRAERAVDVDISEDYDLDYREFEVGDTLHTIIVNSDSLDYNNTYTLEEVR